MHAEPLNGPGNNGVDFPRRAWCATMDLLHQLTLLLRRRIVLRARVKRQSLGKQPVEDDSQTPEVAAGPKEMCFPLQLFRRHVQEGPRTQPTLAPSLSEFERQAEVRDICLALMVDQNVDRFQIAMIQAWTMDCRQG